jgi:hypothetical protein
MFYNPHRTGNTDIGAHAAADTLFRLDFHWSMKALGVRHFLGKTQGDRPHPQIFQQNRKDVHRMNLSMPGNTPRINATRAKPMPHLQ